MHAEGQKWYIGDVEKDLIKTGRKKVESSGERPKEIALLKEFKAQPGL